MLDVNKKKKSHKKIDFLLENNHFRNLHLLIYLVSLCVILVIYTLILIILGKNQLSYIIMLLFSISVGVFLVYKKDEIVIKLSNEMDKRKRINIKRHDRHGLKKTLNNIGIKSSKKGDKLNMKITSKTPLKDSVEKIKTKFNKNKKNSPDYMEIE